MDEASLPIDIQCRKLLDWLISRRICNREWHERICKVREKIGNALKDMPEHPEIRELLSGSNINFFNCKKIVEILKETEKDSKNFFGQYGSQRMTDWKEVLRLYENENIYLAEASQLLIQAVVYELPGLKKQITKSAQIQEECDKREKENCRKAEEFRNDYNTACKNLGIDGSEKQINALKKQVFGLLEGLPDTYSELAEESKKMEPYRNAYHLSGGGELPTLKFLIDRGNLTTYEWIHGEAPLKVEETCYNFEDDEGTVDGNDIDIDFDCIDLNPKPNQDLGEVELDAPADIDWGELEMIDESGNVEIDWDNVESLDTKEDAIDIVIEESGVEGGVARGNDAFSILDNRRTRNMILDELHELEAFYSQRITENHSIEQGGKGSIFSISGLSGNSDIVNDSKVMNNALDSIRDLIKQLTTGKIHHLQLVRSSPKYVDRLVENLKQKLRFVDRCESMNVEISKKRDATIKDQAEAQSKLKVMSSKAKVLQKDIEKDISKRYKDRLVNIQGAQIH